VDSTVAVASLRLHDTLLPAQPGATAQPGAAAQPGATTRFGATTRRWLDGVRQRLDPATGLMPHRVDAQTGAPADSARATSQSIIERFLVEIDPDFAHAQYLRFRDQYLTWPLRLGPAVREYPHGVDGPADVDSGPLPLGVSLSATVVTIGAAQVQGDAPLAAALANYGELLGAPIDTPWTKRYAFGLLPIGDAFLVWSKTARPWVARPPAAPPTRTAWWWRVPLVSLLVVLGVAPWLPAAVRRSGGSARRRALRALGCARRRREHWPRDTPAAGYPRPPTD
jgi:hypothetical protein